MTSGPQRARPASTASVPSAASPTTSMPVLQLEERAQALAHDRVVVDEQHPDRAQPPPTSSAHGRARAGRRVGSRAGRRAAGARSSIEVSPRRRDAQLGRGGSKPTPSSATSSRTRPSRARRRTATCSAPAWRTAFCSASWAIRRTRGRARARRCGRRVDVELDRAPPCTRRSISTCLRSAPHEPVALEVGRAQLEDQRAQLVERLARELAEPLDLRRAPRRGRVEQRRGRLGGEHEAEELLADDVVQLERQPIALRDDRQLAAALVQPRVGDRDRGVRGEQLDQLLVGVVERRRPSFSVR